MRSLAVWTLLLLLSTTGDDAAIIPDQVVSFMHILYSTIPVIRKGTDSRIGLGFRFGPHADAQVLLELGPQKKTEELLIVTTPRSSFEQGKRHVDPDPLLQEHAVNEQEDNLLHVPARARSFHFGETRPPLPAPVSSSDGGGEWLRRWRAGWTAPVKAAAEAAAPQLQRAGRGLRIALASPASSDGNANGAAFALQPAPLSRVVPGDTAASSATALRAPRANPAPSPSPVPMAPALHLRDAMAALSSRTTPRPIRPRARPRQPLQGGLFRALRQLGQLWQAGARRANANA